MTLPRSGSRVRIPSSAPLGLQLTPGGRIKVLMLTTQMKVSSKKLSTQGLVVWVEHYLMKVKESVRVGYLAPRCTPTLKCVVEICVNIGGTVQDHGYVARIKH